MTYRTTMIKLRFFYWPMALLATVANAQAPAVRIAAKPAAKPSAIRQPTALAVFSADRAVTLRPGTDGRVVAVGAVEGSRVRSGAMIVRLDDREQRARVALAGQGAASTAELNAAEVRRKEAQAKLGGISSAAATGAATSWELRQAKAAADQAAEEARMARDRRGIEGQRLQLEQVVLRNYVVTAPFDGRVTRIGARVGMTIRKSDPVATIVDLTLLRGEAFVPVANYNQLKVGAVYRVDFAAPFSGGRRATLAYIDPAIDAGLVRCVFKLDNASEALPSGLQARIQLAPLLK